MKKSIVVGLVALALIVLISPALVGHLAQRSVDRQLEQTVDENQEFVLTATGYDRHWFTSDGQHRIEFANTPAGAALRAQLGLAGGSPALIIDTTLDHGPLPLASMHRDKGSLRPGLGRAESHLSFEDASGTVTQLPGVVYTDIGLTGSVDSHLSLEAASIGDFSWGNADVYMQAGAQQKHRVTSGHLESLGVSKQDSRWSLDGIEFASDVTGTNYGFAIGATRIAISSISYSGPERSATNGPLLVQGNTALNGDRVGGEVRMDMAFADLITAGDSSLLLRLRFEDIDAAAAGRIKRQLGKSRNAAFGAEPAAVFGSVEEDIQALLAAGFELNVEQMDLQGVEGTLASDFRIKLEPSEPGAFAWASVLLKLEASANLSIPTTLYEFALLLNPNIGAAAAMGFLQKNGDNYELAAAYEKGLLTINGAPMALPIR
ncbi:MAG TPA: DUF945 family protein [Woeseiaceae bacterium]|nr:DUF945 family protein [Woeseiaceae bacterium]